MNEISTMEDLLFKLGKRIKFYRNEINVSQEKLAELTNLDRSYINGIENGKRNVSFLVLYRIAKVLNVSFTDLLKDID